MTDIILSRLKITGDPTLETPRCVIDEIWEVHGDVQPTPTDIRVIIQHASTTVSVLRDIQDEKSLSHIAGFLNPFCRWDREPLNKAFNFVQKFMGPVSSSISELGLITSEFTIGQQTPESPQSLNACVLYRLCVGNGMKLQRSTTIIQMASMVRLLVSSQHDLIFKVFGDFSSFDTSMLNKLLINAIGLHNISINSSLGDRPDRKLNDHKLINELYDHLTDVTKLRKRIPWPSNNEAIILAAITYRIDISESKHPVEEWTRMNSRPINNYIPVDKNMARNYNSNSDIYNLTKTFNPFFSDKIYGPILQSLFVDEGYEPADLSNYENVYASLYVAYITPTFYFGWYPEIINPETPIERNVIGDIPQRFLVSFGTRSHGLTAFTLEELAEVFKHSKSFINPLEIQERVNFPTIAMNKLKKYCQKHAEDMKLRTYKRDLLDVMTSIESMSTELGRKFSDITKDIDKKDITDLLDHLFKIAMYMRGWDGKASKYPIEAAPVHNQDIIDNNVSQSISAYNSKCNSSISNKRFNDLPLLSYVDGKFIQADSNQGLTIGGRLTIVMGGIESSNVNACIRLTSNWFAATSHYYKRLTGGISDFDIDKLRSIS